MPRPNTKRLALRRIKVEIDIAERLAKILGDIVSLRDFCVMNGCSVPEPLRRLLGEPEPTVLDEMLVSLSTRPDAVEPNVEISQEMVDALMEGDE